MDKTKTKNTSFWFKVLANGKAVTRGGLLSTGFTLIELLLAIAMIGFLAAVILVSLNPARKKARDAKRLADVKQVITALNIYYLNKGGYPSEPSIINLDDKGLGTGTTPANDGWAATPKGTIFLQNLPPAPTPRDGTCTAAQNRYRYISTSADTYTLTFCLGSPTGGLLDTNGDGRVVGTATEKSITTQ